MSHFTVLVIGENPEKQLAPYQENNMGNCPDKYLEFHEVTPESEGYDSKEEMIEDGYIENEKGKIGYYENPNRKWDWYELGGRWSGFFKLKKQPSQSLCFELEGFGTAEVNNFIDMAIKYPDKFLKVASKYKGKSDLIINQISQMVKSITEGSLPFHKTGRSNARQGYADQCKKKHIDIASMRQEAKEKAVKGWELANKIIDGDFVETWDSVRNRIDNIEEARIFYYSQDVVKRWRAVNDFRYKLGTEIKPYLVSKEDYINSKVDSVLCTFAVIKDGEWYERGSMGWWAFVTDENPNWENGFATMFDSINEDTLLSVYDCHI